jgi:hypothetical protein
VQIISTKNIIRSKNLELKLSELGLKFQISPGVVPNEIDFHDGLLHSAFLSNLICKRKIQRGEVGCALAHRNAIHNFLNTDLKFGFIFEDDAEVIDDFDFDIIMKLLDSNLPIIISLGWIPGFAIAKNLQVDINDQLIELVTPPTCTFAYAINRPAAILMVSAHERIIDLADWPIYVLNKVNFYATSTPWVTANHDPKLSIIGERSTSISNSPINLLISRIRLVSSLIALMLLSKTNTLSVSLKQIVHQLLIRELLHGYGVSQVEENSTTHQVIPLPPKFQKILHFLKLN